jgi:hypothetical protein
VLGNPLRYTDPTGHIACVDDECSVALNPVTFEVYWRGPGEAPEYLPTVLAPAEPPVLTGGQSYFDGSLVEAYVVGVYPAWEPYHPIGWTEFETMLEAVYADVKRKDPKPVFADGIPLIRLAGAYQQGRHAYDTPLWNTRRGEHTPVCVGQHGCYSRTEVNYVAQGIWGALSGEALGDTLQLVEDWNSLYGNIAWSGAGTEGATPGELYWARVGYMWAAHRSATVDQGEMAGANGTSGR